MTEVLSNDQVAALVAAAREGQLPDESAGAPTPRRRRVRKLDFSRPSKFTSDQQRRLERVVENFARTVSTQLSAELRAPISFEVIDVAQLTWGNALEEVPEGSVSGVVEIAPTGGRILLTAERVLILSLLERLLGGPGDEKPAARHLTDVDRALTARLFETMLGELMIAFADLAELRFALVELETERAPAQLAPLSEPSLVLTLEVKIARTSATVVLLIPHRALTAELAPAASSDHLDAHALAAAEAVAAALGDVCVQLRAEVGALDLPLERVLALQPGDVLRLGPGSGADAVLLYADAVALHRTRLGRNERHRAVQVIERAQPEGE